MNNQDLAWSPGDPRELYAVLAEMARQGEPGAVATVIRTARSAPRHSGSKMIVRPDGTITGSVGGGTVEARAIEVAQQVIADGECQRLTLDLTGEVGVCGGEVEIFIEPVDTSLPLWIIGAGHVGRAILKLGSQLPFRFTVVDDRQQFLSDLGQARTLCLTPAELPQHFQPTQRMAVLLATRNHELDGEYLNAVLEAEKQSGCEVDYLGVIGSRTKAKVLTRQYAGSTRRAERFRRLSMPVGLALGAETPPEVALSILAEIVAVLRGVEWIGDHDDERLGLYLQRRRPESH
ncbi:MAG: XdhC family protein [bacterium]